MKKCCRTCRHYRNGECYSYEFEDREEMDLPEVFIKIDKTIVTQDLLDSHEVGWEGFEYVEEIVDSARYVAEYEYENNEFIYTKRPQIRNPERFWCCDYR